jgi:hypothetical protein
MIILVCAWISFALYYEAAKRFVVRNEINGPESQKFKCIDLKDFSLRFYLIASLDFTTWGAFWTFMPMMMQFLEVACDIDYETSKNMLTALPLFSILFIILTMIFSKATKNETKPLFLAALIQFVVFIGIPTMDVQGKIAGQTV